jgi:hypothetical protein
VGVAARDPAVPEQFPVTLPVRGPKNLPRVVMDDSLLMYPLDPVREMGTPLIMRLPVIVSPVFATFVESVTRGISQIALAICGTRRRDRRTASFI